MSTNVSLKPFSNITETQMHIVVVGKFRAWSQKKTHTNNPKRASWCFTVKESQVAFKEYPRAVQPQLWEFGALDQRAVLGTVFWS
jgi:hypothetical protein